TIESAVTAKALSAVFVATGIGALIFAVTLLIQNFDKLKDALSGVNEQQRLLNTIRENAAASIAKEQASLQTLLAIARDETATREARNRAIDELQKRYPAYLGNLSLENINTKQIKENIDK